MLRKISLITVAVTALGLLAGIPAAQAAAPARVVHPPAQQRIASAPHAITSTLAVHPAPHSAGLKGTFPTTAPAAKKSAGVHPDTTPTVSSPAEYGELSLTPAMTMIGTDSGTLTSYFYAHYIGSSSWDILNGTTVSGSSGSRVAVLIPAGKLRIGQGFQWQAKSCNSGGTCSANTALQTGYASPGQAAGSRSGATDLPFAVGHGLSASVDAGTGNLSVNSTQLTLPGISGSVGLGVNYNSLTEATGSTYAGGSAGYGWRDSTGEGIIINRHSAGNTVLVNYLGAGSTADVFESTTGLSTSPTAWKSLDGEKHTLTYINADVPVGAVTLTGVYMEVADHGSGSIQYFNTAGRLMAVTDRNSQLTQFHYTTGTTTDATSVTSSAGTAAEDTATISYDPTSGNLTGFSQTGDQGAGTRTVGYGYDAGGNLHTVTDTGSGTTTFGYDSVHDLTSITAPGGASTTISYDASRRVTAIDQQNPSSPGDAVSRFDYTDGSQTLVAGPDTDQSMQPGAVPHTTYTVSTDGTDRITKAVDPAGDTRSATYTPFGDTATSTNGLNGLTTNTYNPAVNNGESQTTSVSPMGATTAATYGSTQNPYAPDTVTDPQTNQSQYMYDTNGNLMMATDASFNTAIVTDNGDGTLQKSMDAYNHETDYTSTNGQLHTVTYPPTGPMMGTALGVRTFTYDGYGRLATITDGRNITTTYTYNKLDLLTRVDYSDSTHSVVYTYDSADNLHTRADGTGTTTYTYDPEGRTVSITHTAGGGTLAYTYDKAGNLVTEVNGDGTTSYGYNSTDELTSMTTPMGTLLQFAYNGDANRTDTWFNTNASNSAWTVHTQTSYDSADRTTRIRTYRASSNATPYSDVSYCYAKYVSGQTCPTAASSSDTSLLQYSTDNVSNVRTVDGYDNANRLISVTPTTGVSWTYGYNKDGSRTSATPSSGTAQSLSYNYNNVITTSGYGNDAAGDRTSDPNAGTLTYDAAGRMTAASGTASGTYTYAGTNGNELTSQTVPGGTTVNYVYGQPAQSGVPVIDSYTQGTQNTTYIDHDPDGTPLVLQTASGSESFYVTDRLGSPTALINTANVISATYSYDAYGTPTTTSSNGSAAGMNPYRQAGGVYDRTTGWTQDGQRYNDTTTGAFTTPDTTTMLADTTGAASYPYAADNPINNIDPTGNVVISGGFLGYTAYFNHTETTAFAEGGDAAAELAALLPPPFDAIVALYISSVSFVAQLAEVRDECVSISMFGVPSFYSDDNCY